MAASELSWSCASCGKVHRGLPAITFGAPSHYYALPEDERPSRTYLTLDTCVVDDEAFYVRSVLVLPVLACTETLEWGVWSSLSEANFMRYQEAFGSHDQSKLGSMFSWFASWLPDYPDTLNLRCRIIPRDSRQRPLVEFDSSQDHPLIRDWLDGITAERAIAFVEPLLHGL